MGDPYAYPKVRPELAGHYVVTNRIVATFDGQLLVFEEGDLLTDAQAAKLGEPDRSDFNGGRFTVIPPPEESYIGSQQVRTEVAQ